MVSPTKGIFKDFSSGKGGDVITFIQEHERVDFVEAIKILCKKLNIEFTPDENYSPEQIEQYRAEEKKREVYKILYQMANEYYKKQLQNNKNALGYIQMRLENYDMIKRFDIGFAPDGWHNLQEYLTKEKAVLLDVLIESRLISENDNKQTYDFFRNRIIFPIHDEHGNVIAFNARQIPTGNPEIDKKQPKYINSPDTLLYNKSNTLYGLHLARKAIVDKDGAYLVEGPTDCIRMHSIGVANTVAGSGTSITLEQIRKIKKLTKNIVLILDYDKNNAGANATHRTAELIISEGMNCNVIPLPDYDNNNFKVETNDPDSFFNTHEIFDNYKKENLLSYPVYLATELAKNIKSFPDRKAKAIQKLCSLIINYDELLQDFYIEQFNKIINDGKVRSKKPFIDEIKRQRKEKEQETVKEEVEIPDHVDEKFVLENGFWIDDNCYWFKAKEGLMQASNFAIKPLFHIYSKSDNKRLVEIKNEHNYTKIVDIPSKSFISFEQFQQLVFQEGNYLFYGNKYHFMRILSNISNDFPVCNELKTLGWQREGFYAFANGIYNGTWQPCDKYGITQHKEANFFSPAFSSVYSNVREDDDEYENDRYFIYKPSKLKFEDWAKLFKQVYGYDKGMIGIAFMISSLFRDLIYEKYKIFPHLFLFGEKRSGKSQMGWSLSNVFLNQQPAFNLSSGTNVGFFRKLARFRNVCVWYDEYTNDIDEKRFQALKAAYDGIGHEKGKMTKDNRTEVTKINAASIISGQYLPTRDDNALFTRSILLSFQKKQYTPEEMQLFNQLKEVEIEGLSSILTEILSMRNEVDKYYGREFSDIFDSIKGQMMDENRLFDERLVRNFVTIMTPIKIIEKIKGSEYLPFTFSEMQKVAIDYIEDLSQKISDSEALSTFWKLVEFMLDSGAIHYGSDFKIETLEKWQSLSLKTHRGVEKYILEEDTTVLYIRFTQIHPLYMEHHRKQYGHNGVDLTSLQHYINTNSAYLGLSQSTRFKNGINTSAYMFDYNKLASCNLVRDGQNNSDFDFPTAEITNIPDEKNDFPY